MEKREDKLVEKDYSNNLNNRAKKFNKDAIPQPACVLKKYNQS